MKQYVPIYVDPQNASNNLSIDIDVNVGPNEPILNGIINRNSKKLLDNDMQVYELYKKILGSLHVHDWSKNDTYAAGDLVWYVFNGRLFLLKCIIPDNAQTPYIKVMSTGKINNNALRASGWDDQNQYLTVLDYGIEQLLSSKVQTEIVEHQESKYHPFGKVSLDPNSSDYVGHDLLLRDFTNIDDSRKTSFFPHIVEKLNTSRNAILNGYMRVFGDVIEYDVLFKFGNEANNNDNSIFDSASSLSANIATFQAYTGIGRNSTNYNQNEKYFKNSQAYEIFAYENPDYSANTSHCGMLTQLNTNDYINTYAAKIVFPRPFGNLNYMVFANSILSQTANVGAYKQKNLVPSPNDLVFCNKTRESITVLNVMYTNSNKLSAEGHNAKNSGLVANSFHCKIIGTIGE